MKNINSITALTFTGLLLVGCNATQPSFSPDNTVVKVSNGKSYNIPVGANISPYVDEKVIKFYQKIGLNECKDGDTTWEEENAKDEMNIAISKGDRTIYQKLAKEGRIGCASPIN
ncbi:MAG: hypothetical protein DRG78_04540 [Epsilonproteobacteria bacterium]|nr:MAG: hypothetical protein DRG78_04540 [Campylobacterota bacterium]